MNLVINARDAMPEGGTITIETGALELPADLGDLTAGSYGTIQVRDTGMGMTHATLARIFEPFFTTKPVGQGTGLGLATVYGTVTQAKGTVRVTSALGVGSTFTVLLPQHAGEQAPEARGISKINAAVREGGETYLRYRQLELLPELAPGIAQALAQAKMITIAGGDGAGAPAQATGQISAVLQTVLAANILGSAGVVAPAGALRGVENGGSGVARGVTAP